MLKKAVIAFLICLAVFAAAYIFLKRNQAPSAGGGFQQSEFFGERLVYLIRPLGKAEYKDLGIVELWGRRMKLSSFRTEVLSFDDTETIYSSPENFLPLRVERDISIWPLKEKIVEEYDQQNYTLMIRKLKGKKEEEQLFKAAGPIHNAVILPFYLRTIKELAPGWSMVIRLPQEFSVSLAGEEEIEVPAGKFQAYHFSSRPHKFDIWISKDNLRLPLKIKGAAGLDYTLLLKERIMEKK